MLRRAGIQTQTDDSVNQKGLGGCSELGHLNGSVCGQPIVFYVSLVRHGLNAEPARACFGTHIISSETLGE
jgi:hypothetical protein